MPPPLSHLCWLAPALLAASCGDRGDGFSAAPTLGRGAAIAVAGPPSVAPGSTAQFRATTDASGTRRDVTNEAAWTVEGKHFSLLSPGLVSAGDVGQAVVTARHDGGIASVDLIAVPTGTYRLRGQVTPFFAGVPGRVDVLDGPYAGVSAATDDSAQYQIFGVAGPLTLRATMAGHEPAVREVTVSQHLDVAFVLQPGPTPTIAGNWTLTIAAAANCRPEVIALAPMSAPIAIEQDGSQVTLRVQTPIGMVAYPGRLEGTVLSAVVGLDDGGWFDGPGVLLQSASAQVEAMGRFKGVAEGPHVIGSLRGSLQTRTEPFIGCTGTEHRFQLTR